MRHTKTLLACMAASLLLSCSKKDDKKPATPKPSASKVVGSWKVISKIADRPVYHWNTIEYVTDIWDREEECIKDNLFVFSADGKLSGDEGATKCAPANPQNTGAGTWKEESGKLLLSDDAVTDTDSYSIDRLDDSTMVLTGEMWYGINGEKHYYNATTTYRRQ